MSLSVDIHKDFGAFVLDVAFSAEDETLGFLGASGCGKSATLRCIAGIETPDHGRIVVNDTVFFDSEAHINLTPQERKTALLFQNYQLFPNMTVEQNVGAGIDRHTPADARAALIAEEIKRFGLTGMEKRYPAQLSGGQQQRVALARMLAARPQILMLDEPFSALDAHLKGLLEHNLGHLFGQFGGTILYVSHDIDEALGFCDRIAVVESGRIVEIASKHDLVHNPQTLASLKLSGVKNVTRVEYVSDYEVYAPVWGVHIQTERVVPHDVAYIGVRAQYLREGTPGEQNTYEMQVDQVRDARFNRNLLMGFVAREREILAGDVAAVSEAHSSIEGFAGISTERSTEMPSEVAAEDTTEMPTEVSTEASSEHFDASGGGSDAGGQTAHVLDSEDEMKYLHRHVFWRVSLRLDEGSLPQLGQVKWVHIPPESIYVVRAERARER